MCKIGAVVGEMHFYGKKDVFFVETGFVMRMLPVFELKKPIFLEKG